jgi:hypothetical protein
MSTTLYYPTDLREAQWTLLLARPHDLKAFDELTE